MAIATISPVTGEVLKNFDELTPEELEAKLARAVAAAKDAVLITDTARAAGLRLGIAETVRDRLQLAVKSGFGRADVAATYRVPRRTTGRNTDDG
jgi:3-hydroxyisobutyrate dehydrogenase